MGQYANRLGGRLRGQREPKPEPKPGVERLQCAAIQRDGMVHQGPRSHYELRQSLDDPFPQTSNINDVEGFLTTAGRFVTRDEAQDVAVAAGQLRGHQGRPLLSSDIDW